MPEDRVAVYIPPLRTVLEQSERQAGRPLTEADVRSIANTAACMVMPRSEAERLLATREFEDLNPDNVWEEWKALRSSESHTSAASVSYPLALATFPTDPKERHEAFISLFGRHLFVSRNRTRQRIARVVEAPQEHRDRIGKIHREEYDAAAALDENARRVALKLADKAIDAFLVEMLALFTHDGAAIEMAIDDEHTTAYDIVLKVLSRESLEAVEEHVVNRDGEKVPYDYFGRWLNKYKNETELNA